MSKHCYTEVEREALCKKYLSGKQKRKEFCASNDISTKSLSRWLLGVSRAKPKFVSIGKLVESTEVSADILLPNGIDIKLRLHASEVPSFIKGLIS